MHRHINERKDFPFNAVEYLDVMSKSIWTWWYKILQKLRIIPYRFALPKKLHSCSSLTNEIFRQKFRQRTLLKLTASAIAPVGSTLTLTLSPELQVHLYIVQNAPISQKAPQPEDSTSFRWCTAAAESRPCDQRSKRWNTNASQCNYQ